MSFLLLQISFNEFIGSNVLLRCPFMITLFHVFRSWRAEVAVSSFRQHCAWYNIKMNILNKWIFLNVLSGLLLMPSLWTCGLSPAEHLSKYFGALLDCDVDTQRESRLELSLKTLWVTYLMMNFLLLILDCPW